MSTLILNRSDVASLLETEACIRAVEEAFRQHALGSAVAPASLGVHVDRGTFHVKAGGLHGPRALFAAKVNGNFPANPREFRLPTIQGVIVVADLHTGAPVALMDSIEITIRRTAAATAVAAKYLARREASTLTIVGCGAQSRAQARSIARVLPIREVHAYDVEPEAARQFVRAMESELRVPVRAASDLQAALQSSVIVVTCTTATRAFVHPGDLRPGAFVAAVGADNPEKQEIEPALLASATVVADVLEQSATMGDLSHALKAGLLARDDVYAELGEIVAGRKPGRRNDEEIIVFDSTGMALQDVAACALVYERALERGVGRSVDFSS